MDAMSENPRTKLQFPLISQSHHLDAADVSSSATLFCDILAHTDPHDIESALSATGIPPPDLVHQVLKLNYNNPSSAVVFFRWVGRVHKPTPYAWNLMVDLLGRNGLFESMWDAIRSMKQENLLSVATFASVFGSYCAAGRFDEALMSFDVMDRYGIQQDVVALNSLLSAMCSEDNQTIKAFEFFERVKSEIPPDGDTFAILLEGWEKEGNPAKARTTFREMIGCIGWGPSNMPAYDAFLTTLVQASQTDEALKFLHVMKEKACVPGLKFFSSALDMLCKQNDYVNAVPLWDTMVGSGVVPNLIMYNRMIGLLCNNSDIDNAFRLLDEMVFNGVFPDFVTYNMIFQCLIKGKKVYQVGKFFCEMTKNEMSPNHHDCAAAITVLMDGDDPEIAIEIWNYMVENHVLPLDESSNALLIGLCNLGRLSEVRSFADDMLDRKINIYESTMSKMKSTFYKEGSSARDRFDNLSRRWRAS